MTLLMNIINFLMANDIITILYFALLGALVSSTNVSKYLKTHKFEAVVIVVTTLMMVVMTYFKLTKPEQFKNRDRCCPPKGITPNVIHECDSSTFTKCSDGLKEHVVGKFVRGGKYRCMGDGRAYKC
jgi:hypothetical protein